MTTKVLHLSWCGDEKANSDFMMKVFVDNTEVICDYFENGWSSDISFASDELNLKITVGKEDGKQGTWLNRKFNTATDDEYTCEIKGSQKAGLKVKFSEGDEIKAGTPTISSPVTVAFMSFLFPIYGFIVGITNKYHRKEALISGVVGFLFAMIFSFTAESGDKIAFGIGKISILEYDPFSFTDFVINILAGGIASLRGIIYMFFESLV